jgi:hypothetical protein
MDKRGIDFQALDINMFWFWCYAADRDTQSMRLQRYRPERMDYGWSANRKVSSGQPSASLG